ncbi:MAG: hypothetical protein KAG66_08995, partial [Methylococcales bacterium]|nr:hypothetical protein [Methylococcales bacterium]
MESQKRFDNPKYIALIMVAFLLFIGLFGWYRLLNGRAGDEQIQAVIDGSAESPSFLETFDGSPESPASMLDSPRWDVAVHSRDVSTWYQLELMAADYDANCEDPDASDIISQYEEAVYQW